MIICYVNNSHHVVVGRNRSQRRYGSPSQQTQSRELCIYCQININIFFVEGIIIITIRLASDNYENMSLTQTNAIVL